MGIEAIVIGGLALASAGAKMQNAKRQAESHREEGEMQAENLRRENLVKLGRIRAGYLSSGISMSGTPMSIFQDTAMVGQQDVSRTLYNSQQRGRNVMRQARAEAISDLAGTAMTMYTGGSFGGGNTAAKPIQQKDIKWNK